MKTIKQTNYSSFLFLNVVKKYNTWFTFITILVCVFSHSVVSNSLWPHELQPVKLLCSWAYPAKNTEVGCHFLLQGNLPNPGIEPASPASPASAGGFFTSEPPGKPNWFLFIVKMDYCQCKYSLFKFHFVFRTILTCKYTWEGCNWPLANSSLASLIL